MKVFELHFNPKKREDRIFDSFVFEPEKTEEAGLGNLYVVGELIKILPRNSGFLDNLASTIKQEYYDRASFPDALKKAGNLLAEETKNGNVEWLGNLNLAVLNFKDTILNFSKAGDIKILLLREGEILDIGQNLELQENESYAFKVLGNMASGRLLTDDKILILTKEVFSALSQNEEFLNRLNKACNEKELKKTLKEAESIFSKISGICLLLMVSETGTNSFRMPRFFFLSFFNKIVLIFILLLVLATSFLIFGGEKEKKIEKTDQKIEQARAKIKMAENFLIFKQEEKAQALFQEAWDLLSPLVESDSPHKKEAAHLQESLQQYLDSE